MKKYDKKLLFPLSHASCGELGKLCKDIATNEFIGLEYKTEKRMGRFALRQNGDVWEWYNSVVDSVFVSNWLKETAVLAANTSYSTFYIFDSQEELQGWIDEFRDYVTGVLGVDPRGLQCDRIDNEGHYERGNIRFVTAKENSHSRRNIG